MEIRIINKSPNPLPTYATLGSAGLDIRAFLSQESLVLNPLERVLVPTGLFMEIPDGYEAQIRPRSGWALKNGITVLNSPGTIDSDYRGEIKVLLVNLSQESSTLKDGERIAQLIIARHEKITWSLTEEILETNRGSGGYGHTGK